MLISYIVMAGQLESNQCPVYRSPAFYAFFVNEKFCTLIEISLKFVPKGAIDKNSALVKIMAWCRIIIGGMNWNEFQGRAQDIV